MAFLSQLWRRTFFTDIGPIIKLGAERSLEAVDLPLLPQHLDPQTLVIDEAKIEWTSKRFLTSLLLASKRLWYAGTALHMSNAALNLAGPVLVNLFVKRLQAGVETQAAVIEALVYGLGIGGSGILAGICVQHYFFHNLRRTQTLINVVNTKIFRHALVLNKTAREKIAIGDIVNHMSSDTENVAEAATAVNELLYCTVMIVGAMGLLFHYLGSTAWVAVILLGALAPITKKVSREFTRFDEQLMKFRDTRVSLMSQILSAIRLVKYFAWEGSVEKEVDAIRNLELGSRRKIARAELLVTLVYVSVGTFVLFAVLAVHTWRGGHFDPALVFTCVSLFVLLEDPFAFLSRMVSMFISARVASARISSFLSQPTVAVLEGSRAAQGPCGFQINNLSVRFPGCEVATLRDLTLTLAPGQSLAIVGPVGSGKSTLVHALLNEVERSAGGVSWIDSTGTEVDSCRIGYVPQEAYILNGSLRENLTFGHAEISEVEIQRALQLAGLRQDIQALSGGLNTEIGEKGVNLSGGQRQRLSLARAILHRPQVVLLDDPLSAVDANTEAYLVHHLLFGEWKEVSRVVVTHRLTHLALFDQIAFLSEGRLIAVGTWSELRASCGEFRAYIAEYERSHSNLSLEARPSADLTPAVSSGEATRITEDEDRAFGAVSGNVYFDYVRSLGGSNPKTRPLILVLLFFAAASGTAFPLLQKAWLAMVSNAQSGTAGAWTGTWLEKLARTPLTAIYIYGGLGLCVMAATLCADLFWLKRGLLAGRDIHNQMLKSILGAGVRFFDSTPVGRVLQRFSRDMESIDIQLQWSFENSMKCLAQVVITLILIVSALPWVLIFIVPVLFVYYRAQKLYRASAREVKRLDSIARSPRYAHFKETLQGLVVIRAYGQREWFLQEFFKRLSDSQRMFYGNYMVNRWFSTRVPVIGGTVSLCTAVAIVLAARAGTVSPGLAGLLTVYSLSFWGVLNWGIRIWSEVESRMTSLERVRYYSRLPQEQLVSREGAVPVEWPLGGEVRFENVHLRYAEHLPLVLKGLSFEARAGQKVGIVGRTGSGKSTLFQALYRFIELESGRILIDGVDIASLPLPRLRRALAIIPQDPTLFMGSLRSNLDRYGEFADLELWSVLDRTALGDFVRALPAGLSTVLNENGGNLSQGQRQLLCLARALLIKARVIILDEATASVDVQTDALVQRVVRESCAGVTMLIIAHRLGTVRDCDQILEVSEGRLRHHAKAPMIDSGGQLLA